jgi:hypothetical protein
MIDCNDCPHLNITEEQQEHFWKVTKNIFPHICRKYNERVLHCPYREPMIHPCPQCEESMKIANIKMHSDVCSSKPKKIKITSKFDKYLQRSVAWVESKSPEYFSGGTIGSFNAIPIEIDDTIESEYYEIVY